jgi:hypothetical protein
MIGVDISVQRRAAQMAVEALGGVYGVCAYLGVEPEDVYNWMSGGGSMPRECLLKILDIASDDLSPAERRAVEAARRIGQNSAPPADASRR